MIVVISALKFAGANRPLRRTNVATAVGASWTASYDAAGNMTCRVATSATICAGATPTGATLAYDNQGRLSAWQNTPGSSPTQSASFLYDGEGHRVEQVATTSGTTTTTSYIGSLEEVTATGAITTTTAYYGELALSVNGALSYTLSDRLGSVSESVSASTGAVSATQLYAPYGTARYQSGTLPTSKGYTGQRADASTSGLDYYNARYYDPVASQFSSADTTLLGGLNRYGYVGGNPESWVDPSGHHAQVCDAALCLGSGGENVDAGSTGTGEGGGARVADGSLTDSSTLLPVTDTGTEVTYGEGTTGSVQFEEQNGQITGVDGPDGQVLESNAQIEAQTQANGEDHLNQGERPQEGQPGNGNNTPSTTPSTTPSNAVDKAMVATSTDLYRGGNASSPRIDNLRVGKDVILDDAGNIQPIGPDGKPQGMSTFGSAPEGAKNWWMLPEGTELPDGLQVVNDHGDHWLIQPSQAISEEDFRSLLQSISGWVKL